MASIVIIGGGIAGLTTAMLLADDGHEITVLERDPALAPEPAAAWEGWRRRGVSQFRMPHLFVSRFRIEMERELPRVTKALDHAGALRFNPLADVRAQLAGGWRDSDADYEMLTGRRAVVEAVIAAAAGSTPGVTVRRGIPATGLVTGTGDGRHAGGPPHVSGVRTADGGLVPAGLVVDAAGRRSPLPGWLEDCGAARPAEETEDSGFVYYCRHFRSADGTLPPSIGPGLQNHGTVSSLTLPADNGTWAVVIVVSAMDRALHGLRQVERWSAAVRAMPLVAHWIDAEPVEDRIVTLARIEDRHRSLVIDGQPVATGVVALADAWACTNPSLGEGVSMGVMHGQALRDTLRQSDLADALRFVTDFHEATMTTVEPWYRSALHFDRHRLAEIHAEVRGEPYDPPDPSWDAIRTLQFAGRRDPECLRASMAIINVLRTPDQVLAEPGLLERARAAGAGWREAPRLGPTREELVAIATS